MATQPRLVNKQFNSPIGLYSPQNVQEVLEREQQMLANGAIGIDFHNPSVGKPANLQNSAVLRMLEEEENRRGGRAGNGDYYPGPIRDVSWPPPAYKQNNNLHSSFKDVVIPGVKRVAWPPPQEGVLDPAEVVQQNAVQSQGGPQYSTQSPGLQQNNFPQQQQTAPYQQSAPQSYRPLKPLDVSSVGTGSPQASPAINQSPQAYRSATPSKGWAPVHSPVSTPGSGTQKYFGAPNQGYSVQPQHQPVTQPYQGSGSTQQQHQQSVAQQQYQYQVTQQHQQQTKQYQTVGQSYQQSGQYGRQQNQPAVGQQYHQSVQQYQSSGQQQYQPAQQYQGPGHQYQQPAQQYQAPGQQYQQPAQQYQAPGQQYQQPAQPYRPASQQQFSQPQQNQYSQPSAQQYQPHTPPQPSPYQSQPVIAQTQPAAPRPQQTKAVEPPPSIITLRPTAPVSQAPPPVYSAQPATASLKGGKHLRGDLKWPPENVKQQMEEENKKLLELAKGPACRPLKKQRDYTPFFEQHALNSTYPGYKIPPGTQFYRPI